MAEKKTSFGVVGIAVRVGEAVVKTMVTDPGKYGILDKNVMNEFSMQLIFNFACFLTQFVKTIT